MNSSIHSCLLEGEDPNPLFAKINLEITIQIILAKIQPSAWHGRLRLFNASVTLANKLSLFFFFSFLFFFFFSSSSSLQKQSRLIIFNGTCCREVWSRIIIVVVIALSFNNGTVVVVVASIIAAVFKHSPGYVS